MENEKQSLSTFISYKEESLKKQRSGSLGCLYMNAFILSKSKEYPQEVEPVLETVTAILAERPCTERAGIFREIQRHLRGAIRAEDYEYAAVLTEMRDYYQVHIL